MKKTLMMLVILASTTNLVVGKNAQEYFEKGLQLLNKQKAIDAIKAFDKAIALDLNNPAFWLMRGTAYFAIKNHIQAINDYTRAISLSPQIGFYYTKRALAFFALGNTNAMRADLLTAAQLGEPEAQRIVAIYAASNKAYEADVKREISEGISRQLGLKNFSI